MFWQIDDKGGKGRIDRSMTKHNDKPILYSISRVHTLYWLIAKYIILVGFEGQSLVYGQAHCLREIITFRSLIQCSGSLLCI